MNRMLRHLLLLALATATVLAITPRLPAFAQSVPSAQSVPPDSLRSELVVLLHGMGRTSRSMDPLQEALEAAGFDVVNIGYSSYCCDISELGETIRGELDARRLPRHTTVHFVGHSLGGILARWVLAQPNPPAGASRLVMLAPPNQGSKSADRYAPFIGWLLEPIDELRTDSTATVQQIPAPNGVQVGIIAGRQDGKLTVEETHLVGESAHIVVEGTHSFLMRRDEVKRFTIAFLRTGRFSEAGIAEPADDPANDPANESASGLTERW